MKKKPIDISFLPCYDKVLSCPCCESPIIFPLNSKEKPKKCSQCGQEFDWE